MIKIFLKKIHLWEPFLLLIYTFSIWKIMRRFFKDRILILYYHNLNIKRKPQTSILNPVINPGEFARQMKHLKKYYNLISIDKCIEALQGKIELPSYSVVVTFDDGYASQYQYAFPILREMGIKAIFFINPSFIGTNDLFWWEELEYLILYCRKKNITIQIAGQEMVYELKDREQRKQICETIFNIFLKLDRQHRNELLCLLRETSGIKASGDKNFLEDYRCLNQEMIKEMSSAGLRIGSHTISHPVLTTETYETQKQEIVNSLKYLDTSRPLHFAYPCGYFNTDTVQILKSCGFQSALTALPGFVTKGDDLYRLRRWGAKPDFLEFVSDISGLDYFFAKVEQILTRFRRLIKR